MSDLNTAGLNGNGRPIADVANHAVLVLLARLMAALGVPVAIWLFLQVWDGLAAIEQIVRVNQTAIAVQEYRLGQSERRVGALESFAREQQ